MAMSLTLDQKPNYSGFPKAGELIEITGAHALEASDRAMLNALYQHAHESGQLAIPGATWDVPMTALRSSTHQSNDRLRDSLSRLLSVQVVVSYRDTKTNRALTLQTHLFDAFVTPTDTTASGGFVRFGVPDMLRAVLAQSGRWGRIKAEVVCAMTSKYAIALYELVQLRAGLDRCIEQFPIERFRDLLGVPPGKLLRGPDFLRYCITPALLEVNGLSELGVQIDLVRAHPRAPVTAAAMTWWRKDPEDFKQAYKERQRSKAGRLARLRGTTDADTAVTLTLAAPLDPKQSGQNTPSKLRRKRAAGKT
jgi:uncharacterized protein YeaO (DUF488 family)